MRVTVSVCLLVTLLMPAAVLAAAGQPEAQAQDLKTLSLEELMEIDVTTVSRGTERRIEVPAAVSVITAEDLRRYAVDTLADALRLGDSLSVARYNGGSWAIATRGFAATTNNKMLVMIDGRSVYTPLFGGVFWEGQHVLFPDIDRIEIIRGPAGTMWGPNAVNGVINIITKSSADTTGALVRGVTGSRERAHVLARYGGTLSSKTTYRLYAVGNEFGSPQLQDGTDAGEDRTLREGGGRMDWQSGASHLTVQGDGLRSVMDLSDGRLITMHNANVVATFSRQKTPESAWQIVGYVDGEERDAQGQTWENRTTYNLDGHHASRLTPRVHVIWGGGLRSTMSRTKRTPLVFFEPENRTIHQAHGFAQTELAVGRRVSLTLGTRGERTTFSGFELQPSVRAKYTPTADSLLWAAISRAVRTPTRFDQDLRVHNNGVVFIRGDRDFRPEHLIAYESGARFQTAGHVSIEAAVFYHDYGHLRSQEGVLPSIRLANLYDGYTTGVELAADVQPRQGWLVHGSYTGQRVALHPTPGSLDVTNARAEADDPSHIVALRSYVNLPKGFELDAFFRAIGQLRASKLPGYRELDLRLGRKLNDEFDIAVMGRDLLHARHPEFAGATPQLRYFQREVAVRLTWQRK